MFVLKFLLFMKEILFYIFKIFFHLITFKQNMEQPLGCLKNRKQAIQVAVHLQNQNINNTVFRHFNYAK